ncbi:thymidylate kinase [Lycorma delicatula]|uniref:thymidylate kinase n=1 Tax=Lycorma delicatula TaxID=130591 RepID=UPI003F51466F
MRGALIVFEGGDRCGKTTQCKRIVAALREKAIPSEFLAFPDRGTVTGKVINDYLLKKEELSDQAVHLLFTANRWELVPKMRQLLFSGTSLIVDRYSFSGVAFSASKKGVDFDWCKQIETGLPKPDLVFLFKVGTDEISQRSGWGNERYEDVEFQRLVAENFQRLIDKSFWKEIDANKSIDSLTSELLPDIYDAIKTAKTSPLQELW